MIKMGKSVVHKIFSMTRAKKKNKYTFCLIKEVHLSYRMTLKVVFHISILLISLYLYYLLKNGVAFVIILILIDRTMGINIESFGIFKLNFNTGKGVFINAQRAVTQPTS